MKTKDSLVNLIVSFVVRLCGADAVTESIPVTESYVVPLITCILFPCKEVFPGALKIVIGSGLARTNSCNDGLKVCGSVLTIPVFVVNIVEVPTVSTLNDACGSGKIGPVIPAVDGQVNASPANVISSPTLNP